MRIYTRTGDKGKTSLFSGERVPKNDPRIDAIGHVDECNSLLGAAVAHLPKEQKFEEIRKQLEDTQHALFDVGAALATPRNSKAPEVKKEKTRFGIHATELLEQWIDAMDVQLPPLTAFILPGGHPSGALLHVARSVCRRAERSITPLIIDTSVSEHVFIYLNRLSDYLFVSARYINHLIGCPETLWEHHRLEK
jgi:cob(I)alamin adenosyltransferase